MKITFQEICAKQQWIHRELLSSLTHELITEAREDQFYEVKLLINGVEIEPVIFNEVMANLEKYIDKEANLLILEKLKQAKKK